MNEKSTGYVLLIAGLFIMIGALIYVLLVFTGTTSPLKIFEITAPTISLNSLIPTMSLLPSTNPHPLEIIPTSAFNKILNLSTTLFLMGFVLSFGFKIASLGIMLLRPINVKLATNKTDTPA